MSRYHAHQVTLSKDNVRHILSGHGTVLSHDQLKNKNHTIYLTHKQKTTLDHAHQEGRHAKLSKFSKAQLLHNFAGKGFFGDLYNKVKKHISPHAQKLADIAKPHLEKLASHVVNKGSDYLKGKIQQHAPEALKGVAHSVLNKATSHAHSIAQKGVNAAHSAGKAKLNSYLGGEGLKKKRAYNRKGKGLASPGGRGLSSPGASFARGLGVKKTRGKLGKGFYAEPTTYRATGYVGKAGKNLVGSNLEFTRPGSLNYSK